MVLAAEFEAVEADTARVEADIRAEVAKLQADAVAAERERLREELLPLILVNGYCQRCGFHSPGSKIVALLAPQTKEKE